MAPPVVETVQPPQPILPVLKPGTKKRVPAKPAVDPVEEAAAAPVADTIAAEGAEPAVEATADTDSATAQQPQDDVGILLGTVPPNPEVVAAEPEPEPVQSATATDSASPDDLRGQTEIQVINVLGSPVSTRAEGTSTIWSYRSDACTLDVYFFLDVADNQRRALSYELIARQTGAQAGERCYKALKAAAAAN